MKNKIHTFNTNQFMDKFMKPDPKLKEIITSEYGSFFMVKVQDLIKISKVPVPPTRAITHSMIFLTSGIATMKIGFHNVKIGKNQCLVVPAGQVFCYDKYEVNTGFLCNFDNDFLVGKIGNPNMLNDFDFLNIWGNPIIKPTAKTSTYLAQTFQRVLDEYAANGLKNPQILQAYFIAALYDLNAAYKPLSNSKSKTATALTNRFKGLLHQHIRSKHLVTDYAGMLSISPNHLNKIVKETTGKSPSRWIDESLVTEAKVLLFQTPDLINEIAAEIGIYDQSYFSRLFKKYEKVSPVEFRKMIEKS